MKVICISGKAGSGKDTFACMLKNELEASGKQVLITHYADLVKYTCATYFNWDGQKDEKGRSLLQYIGTDRVRTNSPDFWVNFVASIITIFADRWDVVLIPDTRFENEIEVLRYHDLNPITVRIERQNSQINLINSQMTHISETALDDYKFDYVVRNDGSVDDLRGIAINFIRTGVV